MSPRVLLFLIFVTSLGVFHVRSSDDPEGKACEDPPVFSPSHLVVRHGEPTSATCTVCQENCRNKDFGLEIAMGNKSTNGTTITWTVDRMTEWDTSALCYYNNGSQQCYSELPITVYQFPAEVSFSFVNHSGPLILGHTYTMQCLVKDVAPVGGVIVIFHEGKTLLAQIALDGEEKTPASKAAHLEYRPERGYPNWSYDCAAILQVGTQHQSMWSSGALNVDTHFPPLLDVPPRPDPVNITEGGALSLNCSASGSPSASYRWTLPSGRIITHTSTLTLESVSVSDGGRYVCFASNYLGNATVEYSVFVQRVTTTTAAATTQTVLDTTAAITTTTGTTATTGTTSSISTGSTGRTSIPRFTLCFMLYFLVLV